ncbi:hypothetical protein SSP24_29440 [Streptomyces spinoverrucosus]|uniref:Uncharacterized protein n=1 Tax=Streptomyces spinoverrucosus TaxID=284043 RepID=A0A4Y3VHZ0_9ACTN|nr:hypothetical protein [Streptomyces spinoverrucosus]GEC05289.1 hypothetical protein SSP24_29440 [Streptomyces spinoverrucosus]GHB79350.1 hypothetical protein GCM10010397_57600 [Streptomyces spinoverrucosus]
MRALSPQLRFALSAARPGPARRSQPARWGRCEETGTVQGLPEDRAVVEEVFQGLGGDLVLVGVAGGQRQAGEAFEPPDPHGPGAYPALVSQLLQLLQLLGDGLETGDVPVTDAGRVGAGEATGRGREEPQLPGNLNRADPGIVPDRLGKPVP